MTKNIKYSCSYDEFEKFIKPSKTFIPDWYKKIFSWPGNKLQPGKVMEKSVKQCMPFFDALTSGYMITTPTDLFVVQTDAGPRFEWIHTYHDLVQTRSAEVNKEIPIPAGHHQTHFVWKNTHSIQIPKGYSALFTHPLNRHDLPFITLSGIFDGDFVLYEGGSIPFFMNSTFEGVIPQGTPIAQILPFKREPWKISKDEKLTDIGKRHERESLAVFIGWYKNAFWNKKRYD